MTIPQQAVEAATESHLRHNPIESLNLGQYRTQITCSCGHIYRVDGHSEERQESFLDHVYKIALTAALPALERQIREQIAQEIEAVRPASQPARKGRTTTHYALTFAAQIARGEQ